MKLFGVAIILAISTVSFGQINVKGIGNKAKNRTEKKVKEKAGKKAKETYDEATRDPKDPPTTSDPLYHPYRYVKKYVDELKHIATSRLSNSEYNKKQIGTDEERTFDLSFSKDYVEKAEKEQNRFDKVKQRALDSLEAFNKKNVDNKKGVPRYETTFQEQIDSAVTIFDEGQKYFVDKYQKALETKRAIDAGLKRKREIEEYISKNMAYHLGIIFRDKYALEDNSLIFGEAFKQAVEKVDWTELEKLTVEWSDIIAKWRELLPADTKYVYKSPEEEEHLFVKTDNRHNMACPGDGNYLENYKDWYEEYVLGEIEERMEWLPTSTEAFPDSKTKQYIAAKSTLLETSGAAQLFPSNSTITNAKKKSQEFHDNLVASLPGSAFHKENFAKVVIFGKRITPGSETAADVRNTWKYGQELTGMYFMIDPIRYEFRNFEETGGLQSIGFEVESENPKIKFGLMYLPLINRKNLEDPYAYFDFFPEVESIKGYYGARYERHFSNLKDLPVGTYTIKITRDPDLESERKTKPINSNEITLEITQEALDYFNRAYEKAKKERMNLVRPGKSRMSDGNVVTAVKRSYADDGGQVLRVVITSSIWDVVKNDYGNPSRKRVSVDVVYKRKDGQCVLVDGTVSRDHAGGGSYGTPYFSHVHNETEMLCGNANK